MRAMTKGAQLTVKLDEPAQMVRDAIEAGLMSKPTAEDVERWAEEEFSARTDGGWTGLTCDRCWERFSVSGVCNCSDEPIGEMELAVMALRQCGLLAPGQ